MAPDRTEPVSGAPGGEASARALRLYSWTDPQVMSLAIIALAAGFAQYSVITSLGDVAKAFGQVTHGTSIAEQAGLSGTVVGLGLAIIRLASLAGLPLASSADRFGRRRMIVGTCAIGLALTALAAASPGYWWFVAIFAFGRPFLSAAAAIAQVGAAEQTSATHRSMGVALVAAGYAVGAGLIAILHGLAGNLIGFRGLFAVAVVPLIALPLIGARVAEPDRYARAAAARTANRPALGTVARPYWRRLGIVAGIGFAVSVVTGPANSFIFFYGQNVLRLSGTTLALMVVSAGVTGLAGLIAGRWTADHWGRRPAASAAMIAVWLSATLAYSGSPTALFVGYLSGIFSGASFAPAAGALVNELFPTSVRASVSGWYVATGVVGAAAGLLTFGTIAGNGNHFLLAGLVTFAVALPAAAMFWLVPETNGREPEELWPDEP